MLSELAKAITTNPARALVMGSGVALATTSPVIAVATEGNDPYATWMLGLGALLLLAGGLIPWLKRLGFSPMTGLQVEARDEAQAGSLDVAESQELRSIGIAIPEADENEAVGVARLFGANAAIERLLNQPERDELLGDCEWHLYLFDEDQKRLLPVFEPEDDDGSEGWAPGQGATGAAWSSREYVLVTGTEASDETYGLTPQQQERYKDLTAVAAMPVQSWSGDVIGVLSASTTSPDTKLATPEGFEAHLVRAMVVSRLLIDLLRWFPDDDPS